MDTPRPPAISKTSRISTVRDRWSNSSAAEKPEPFAVALSITAATSCVRGDAEEWSGAALPKPIGETRADGWSPNVSVAPMGAACALASSATCPSRSGTLALQSCDPIQKLSRIETGNDAPLAQFPTASRNGRGGKPSSYSSGASAGHHVSRSDAMKRPSAPRDDHDERTRASVSGE